MKPKRDKIAVVIIHGMGEQKPMETLRGFVEAAWSGDRAVIEAGEKAVYVKPDEINRSYELRRITTRYSATLGGRCDFFEFYWANLMSGNTPASMITWIVRLLVRRRRTVPDRLVGHWIFGLVLLAAIALGFALLTWPMLRDKAEGLAGLATFAGIVVVLATLVRFALPTLTKIVGDAARYFTPAPDNIGARQSIREAGVDLLTRLNEDGDYKRIILVAHSLGSAVGYDLLTHAWARLDPEALGRAHEAGGETAAALARVESAAGALRSAAPDAVAGARAAYRDAQRAYWDRLALPRGDDPPLWLVSDFVTMGSPLSKAEVLIARDQAALDRMVRDRESPTCPPEPDGPGSSAFSYKRPKAPGPVPHHAAPFGPTVWTNVYFTNPGIVFGDVVGGETAPRLGRGIADVRIERGKAVFRHLDYWSTPKRTPPPGPWIKALRAALNLRRLGEADLWGPKAGAQTPIRAEDLP